LVSQLELASGLGSEWAWASEWVWAWASGLESESGVAQSETESAAVRWGLVCRCPSA
jgi:hypothetical protein